MVIEWQPSFFYKFFVLVSLFFTRLRSCSKLYIGDIHQFTMQYIQLTWTTDAIHYKCTNGRPMCLDIITSLVVSKYVVRVLCFPLWNKLFITNSTCLIKIATVPVLDHNLCNRVSSKHVAHQEPNINRLERDLSSCK